MTRGLMGLGSGPPLAPCVTSGKAPTFPMLPLL